MSRTFSQITGLLMNWSDTDTVIPHCQRVWHTPQNKGTNKAEGIHYHNTVISTTTQILLHALETMCAVQCVCPGIVGVVWPPHFIAWLIKPVTVLLSSVSLRNSITHNITQTKRIYCKGSFIASDRREIPRMELFSTIYCILILI